MSIVGENIKKRREKAGLSQNKLAKKAGIAHATLHSIEAETKSPSVDTVQLLASALGCTVAELLGESTRGASLTPEEQLILRAYRAASEPIRGAVRDILHVAAEPPARRSAAGAV